MRIAWARAVAPGGLIIAIIWGGPERLCVLRQSFAFVSRLEAADLALQDRSSSSSSLQLQTTRRQSEPRGEVETFVHSTELCHVSFKR